MSVVPAGMSTIRREEHARLARIETEHDRCLDMLADFPGVTLPDRLAKLIGEWLVCKLREGAAEALGVMQIEIVNMPVGEKKDLSPEPKQPKQAVTPRGYCPAGATGGDGVVFRAGDFCYWVDPNSREEWLVKVMSVGSDGTAAITLNHRDVHCVVKWEALLLHKRAGQ